MPKITKTRIDATDTDPERDVLVWDSELPGFGLRIKKSGVRTFLIQYRNKHGRSRRYSIGRYGVLTPEKARKRARQLLNAIADGYDPAEQRAADRAAMSISDLCDEYLEKARAGQILTRRGGRKKASTIYTDVGRIERHIKPLIGHRSLNELSRQDIVSMRDAIIAGKTAQDVKTGPRGRAIVRGGSGVAARTMGLFGAIIAYAVTQGYRDDNPARGIVRPADKRRSTRMSGEQYRALGKVLRAAEERGEPWQAIKAIRLLALTGCRRGEVLGLRWNEIDRSAHCLRLDDTKTGASIRPIGEEALTVLGEGTGKGFVLPGIRGAESFGGLPKAWLRIVKGEELEGLTPHGLRHAFASVAEELGYTLPTIGALLGHAGQGVTAGYIHKPDSALVAAADSVSAFICEAMNRGALDDC